MPARGTCSQRRRLLAWVVGLASLSLLTGCEPKMEIRLASAKEWLPEPRFDVEEVDHRGERPRYDTVRVFDADGNLLWHLRAEPFGDQNSVRHLTYGLAPAGFAVVVPPRELKPGVEYAIVVEGTARGHLRFRADAGGLVQPRS